jgi:hypothetical protein
MKYFTVCSTNVSSIRQGSITERSPRLVTMHPGRDINVSDKEVMIKESGYSETSELQPFQK